MKVKAITARFSRGMILDVVVFVANLALMNVLAGYFLKLVRLANDGGDRVAQFALFLFALGMLVLPAAGAVLKRWHFHRRGGRGADDAHFSGCLPIFHFVLSLILSSGVVIYFQKRILIGGSGDQGELDLLFWLVFVAMLIYFPPRIFYLAEDFKRPGAWFTMLLANSPVILRALFGGLLNVRG